MGLLNWWRRRLTSYGFGVHSPFAYKFIKCVLREEYPYYCFDNEVRTRPERCLFRVANYFQPARVALLGADTARARELILMACPRAEIVTEIDADNADFTYTTGPIPAHFKVLYSAHPAEVTDAMTFTNGHTIIAVRRPGLPPQSFTLNF